jgi:hypothetical protein
MALIDEINLLKSIFADEKSDDYELLMDIRSLFEIKKNVKGQKKSRNPLHNAEEKEKLDCQNAMCAMFENMIYIINFPEKVKEHYWYDIFWQGEKEIAFLMVISPKNINEDYINSIFDEVLERANVIAQKNGIKTPMSFTWDDIFDH